DHLADRRLRHAHALRQLDCARLALSRDQIGDQFDIILDQLRLVRLAHIAVLARENFRIKQLARTVLDVIETVLVAYYARGAGPYSPSHTSPSATSIPLPMQRSAQRDTRPTP